VSIKKTLPKSTLALEEGGGVETQKTIDFCGKLSFIFLSFFLSTSSAATTYIFTAPTCTTIIIILEPCALNAKFQRLI
jgi:hypothetical protein